MMRAKCAVVEKKGSKTLQIPLESLHERLRFLVCLFAQIDIHNAKTSVCQLVLSFTAFLICRKKDSSRRCRKFINHGRQFLQVRFSEITGEWPVQISEFAPDAISKVLVVRPVSNDHQFGDAGQCCDVFNNGIEGEAKKVEAKNINPCAAERPRWSSRRPIDWRQSSVRPD
jgi:hypothetical protein